MKKYSLVNPVISILCGAAFLTFTILVILMPFRFVKDSWDWHGIELVLMGIGAIGFLILLYYCLRLRLVIDFEKRTIKTFSKFKTTTINIADIVSLSVQDTKSPDGNSFSHFVIIDKGKPRYPIKVSLSFIGKKKRKEVVDTLTRAIKNQADKLDL